MILLTDYTTMLVLVAVLCFGFSAGVCGVFVLLRGQSLLGDAISHATLPGIALTFLYTQRKDPLLLIMGGILSGAIGALVMHVLVRVTSLKKDAILGTVLSVFFGIGVVLITVIQKTPSSQQSILNKFLFGSVATLLYTDVSIMLIASMVICLLIGIFLKELCLVCFDPAYARVIGYRVEGIETFLTILIIMVIALGLQAVGVVLMSTLLVAPAAAARQWTTRVSSMMIVSGIIGGVAGMGGVLISASVEHLPTGPMIVVILSLLVLISLVLGKPFSRVKRTL